VTDSGMVSSGTIGSSVAELNDADVAWSNVVNSGMIGSEMLGSMIDPDMLNWDNTYTVKLGNKAFVRFSINWSGIADSSVADLIHGVSTNLTSSSLFQ
jgi:hypothetical protein